MSNNQLVIVFINIYLISILFIPSAVSNEDWDPDLLPEHLPYYFNSNPEKRIQYCKRNNHSSLCKHNAQSSCWGYEVDCNSYYKKPICEGDHSGWVNTKKEQFNTFYSQADFGYVRDRRNNLMKICESWSPEHSFMECSEHLQYCRGQNIFVNFSSLKNRNENFRYQMDVLKDGEIGGHCTLDEKMLREECDQISPLQSWAPELQHFKSLRKSSCDITVKQTTLFLKIDAAVNMYHHFCDFLNLYASQHINNGEDMFSRDVQILIWETYPYRSAFEDTFEAFTQYPIWNLNQFKGKTVCFDKLIFPLLPRMIFGLYYNTPLISGCEGSGLFDAFHKHVLHRLRIPFHQRANSKVRVTFLSRDTTYRRVINERQLIRSVENITNLDVSKVIYSYNMPFKEQLEITRNTDVFISMHGAGLTHLLFLPEWAVVFELYNCEDPNCYADLARLKGVKYMTWEDHGKVYPQDEGKHPDGGAHAKFTNYKFEVKEFVRLVKKAAEYVESQPLFLEIINHHKNHDEL